MLTVDWGEWSTIIIVRRYQPWPTRGEIAMFTRFALAVAATAALGAVAQDFPTRNITMVVPYAAGGPTATVARVLAQAMTKPLGHTVVVESKPSAGGLVGVEPVKNAKRGGYTILS